MSHFSNVKTRCKNKDALKKALESINKGQFKGKLEIHDTPQNLYGYHGDVREQKANIIIRRKHIGGSSNDIGFIRQADGTYQAIISDFDRSSMHYNDEWLSKLNQLYSLEVVRQTANSNGFTFEFTEMNEEIYVTCEKD